MTPPPRPLAVFTPLLGRWGQPWIKAHIEQILPGRTVVLAVCAFEASGPCWGVEAPALYVPPRLPAVFTPTTCESTMFSRLPEPHRAEFASARHRARMKTFLIEHGVKAILAQWLDVSLPLVDLAHELGIRYYCQAHGTDITAALRDASVRSRYSRYNDIDAVIAPSEFGRRQLVEIGIVPQRTAVIRHPVSAPRTLVQEPSADGPVRCLAAGRLDAAKGPLILIGAFARALRRCPSLHLDYAGDGGLMPAVRDAVRRLAIADRVTFHGFVCHATLLDLMRRSSILLQPSVAADRRYDTAPVVVSEAMAWGKAIVATRHGGIPEMISDGETGLLVEEGDVGALADRLVALGTDPDLGRRLGLAAWRRARVMFAPGLVQRQWLDLLRLPAGPTAS